MAGAHAQFIPIPFHSSYCEIVRVRVVLKRTFFGDWCFDNLGRSHLQEVIFRVKWIVFISRWCCKSGPLKVIGQFSHDGIGWKSNWLVFQHTELSPSQCKLWFVSWWFTAMWFLASPFLLACLCSVSRVLWFMPASPDKEQTGSSLQDQMLWLPDLPLEYLTNLWLT